MATSSAESEAPIPRAGMGFATAALLTVSLLTQVAALLLQRLAGLRTGTESVVSTWLDPFSLGGIACLALNGAVWPLVLRRVPLGRAYPFMAFIAPLELFAAASIMGESVRPLHLVGVAFLVVGVWILTARKR